MSIVNQIKPLNLNPVLIILQKLQYQFERNKSDVISSFDDQLSSLDNDIENINKAIKENDSNTVISTDELNRMNINTTGCSVSDINKRRRNINKALNDRKSQLVSDRNKILNDKNKNELFYNRIIDIFKNIIDRFIKLLTDLLDRIGSALNALENAILALSAIPLGGGLSAATSLGFVSDLLQTKIFEPVSDTISQHNRFQQ